MTHLLHCRLRFVYKKTKQVPGKLDFFKQEQFKAEYEESETEQKEIDKIGQVDASHPQHNNMPFYGWIYKGVTKTIKANTYLSNTHEWVLHWDNLALRRLGVYWIWFFIFILVKQLFSFRELFPGNHICDGGGNVHHGQNLFPAGSTPIKLTLSSRNSLNNSMALEPPPTQPIHISRQSSFHF